MYQTIKNTGSVLFKFEKRINKYIKYFGENVHIHNIYVIYAACTLSMCVYAYKKNIYVHIYDVNTNI